MLEFGAIGARILGEGHEIHGSFEVTVVISSDVRYEIRGLLRAYRPITNSETAHRTTLAGARLWGRG